MLCLSSVVYLKPILRLLAVYLKYFGKLTRVFLCHKWEQHVTINFSLFICAIHETEIHSSNEEILGGLVEKI